MEFRLGWIFLLIFAYLRVTVDAVCSFDRCGEEDNNSYVVHIVPHSHMDLGWLKTVQQYFFGTNAKENSLAVQYIYDSVVSELLTDENKRFIFVETGFFELWWHHRGNESREAFRKLVNNGQIEFISGGYVMNDEAATYYTNTIDQMTLGLGILKDIFGECGVSKIGWQIDPFGHSREFASLLSQMNFEGLFLGRIDYQDKDAREASAIMEFRWQASESLSNSQLTGVVLANNYSPPPGFCFDIYCDDEKIVEDRHSKEYNIEKKTAELVNWIRNRAPFFATDNFLVTMGNDFNYHSAHMWMANLDAIIRYVNSHPGFLINGKRVRLQYSTPSCYLKAIKKAKLAKKFDDFFPYASDPHAFWTGYFTSRPAFKYLDRLANNWLQGAKQLAAMAGLGSGRLHPLPRVLAIAQHHDAVTGTAKQHVNNDYTRLISEGLDKAYQVTAEAFQSLGKTDGDNLLLCKSLNISECDEIDDLLLNQGISVTAFNPSSQIVQTHLRVPVSNGKLTFNVTGSKGEHIPYDLLPIPEGVLKLAERSGKATHEIVFPVKISPHGFTNVNIKPKGSRKPFGLYPDTAGSTFEVVKSSDIITERRGNTELKIHPKKGVVGLSMNGMTANITQGYYYYKSHAGDNHDFAFRASGAYVFRPNNTEPVKVPLVSQKVIRGFLLTEVHTVYTDWLSDVIRLTNTGELEFEWLIGPIPVDDEVGKEIIWRLNTGIDSGADFFTDSNGRETIRRVRDHRPTWNLSLVEPVAGNYYPVNSRISIRDKHLEPVVLTDRSVGGSSLSSGEIELMLHRRCLFDDAFGVNEALNETGFDGRGLQIRGGHSLSFETPGSVNSRSATVRRALKPLVIFSKKPFETSQSIINSAALPENVQLLTFEQVAKNEYLIRLEHILERRSGAGVAYVNLSTLFNNRVSSVKETYLAANIDKESKGFIRTVRLYPMEIRTFIVTLR